MRDSFDSVPENRESFSHQSTAVESRLTIELATEDTFEQFPRQRASLLGVRRCIFDPRPPPWDIGMLSLASAFASAMDQGC